MNPTAAYFAELKAYAADQCRHLEATCQQTPDILLCLFHNFCFYEETLGHCKEWTPELTPNWLSPDYEENVTEWHTNTTDILLVTINELTAEHNVVLTNNLRHLLGNQRNPLHRVSHQRASPQPSTPPRSVLLLTTTIDSIKVPIDRLRLVNPARHTPTHRYPLRSLDSRTTVKNVTPRSLNLGRNLKRRERRTKKLYDVCRRTNPKSD